VYRWKVELTLASGAVAGGAAEGAAGAGDGIFGAEDGILGAGAGNLGAGAACGAPPTAGGAALVLLPENALMAASKAAFTWADSIVARLFANAGTLLDTAVTRPPDLVFCVANIWLTV
jgi:hypothetical protein